MTPQLKEKESLIAQIEQKDVLLSYPFENIKSLPTCFMKRQETIL